MMAKKKTTGANDERARQLLKALEIHEEVVRTSKELSSEQRKLVLTSLEQERELLTTPRGQTTSALRYSEDAIIGPFNEESGPDADRFWKKVAEAGLDFKRRDVIREILERKRINNRVEYDLVVDLVDTLEDDKKITRAEAQTLRDLAEKYSKR